MILFPPDTKHLIWTTKENKVIFVLGHVLVEKWKWCRFNMWDKARFAQTTGGLILFPAGLDAQFECAEKTWPTLCFWKFSYLGFGLESPFLNSHKIAVVFEDWSPSPCFMVWVSTFVINQEHEATWSEKKIKFLKAGPGWDGTSLHTCKPTSWVESLPQASSC